MKRDTAVDYVQGHPDSYEGHDGDQLPQPLPQRDRVSSAASSLRSRPGAMTHDADFALHEATIADLQAAMEAGELTCRSAAQLYLDRIDRLDRQGPELRAIIETNPDALAIADALDAERAANGARGPLHVGVDPRDPATAPSAGEA